MSQSEFEAHGVRCFEVNGWQAITVNDSPVVVQRPPDQTTFVRVRNYPTFVRPR